MRIYRKERKKKELCKTPDAAISHLYVNLLSHNKMV